MYVRIFLTLSENEVVLLHKVVEGVFAQLVDITGGRNSGEAEETP